MLSTVILVTVFSLAAIAAVTALFLALAAAKREERAELAAEAMTRWEWILDMHNGDVLTASMYLARHENELA